MNIERKAELICGGAAAITAALDLAIKGLPEHTREGCDAADLAERLDLLWVTVRPLAERVEMDARGILVKARQGGA
jgi:hypothetical protein